MENIFNQVSTLAELKNFVSNLNFITTALPYANGQLHTGHIFEAIVAQVYKENQSQHSVFISGDDQHGVAITLYAKNNKIDETTHIQNQWDKHQKQYEHLAIKYDYFGGTHNEFHQKLVNYFFQKLIKQGKIFKKETLSWFDVKENQFLPDRFVRGSCPHCYSENQYPEICEACGEHFSNTELLNPCSQLSKTRPILKSSLHYFLDTKNFYDNLTLILNQSPDLLCYKAKAKVLDGSLKTQNELDISRDNPYFGIDIVDSEKATSQSFYVWFDAPIGYLSFALSWIKNEYFKAQNIELSFDELTQILPYIKFEHFIGKDIVYFHTYYWLNLLRILELNSVKKIYTHGWITQKGEKLSKSQKNANTNLNELNIAQIDALRLYLFSHYENDIQDIDLNEELVWQHYNQVIVAKLANLFSRTSKIVETKLNNQLISTSINNPFINQLSEIQHLINLAQFKEAFQKWVILLNDLNAYFQQSEVWKEVNVEKIKEVCHVCLDSIFQFKWLKTVCPNLSEIIDNQFNHWQLNNTINHTHLAKKIE